MSDHLINRIKAVVEGVSDARSAIESIKDLILPKIEGKIRDTLSKQLDRALKSLAMASEAIRGEDEQ